MTALALLVLLSTLTTEAEQSGWKRTGRYAEVEALCEAFPRRYPGKVRCERFGVSPEGRPLLALIASADGTFAAGKRPVVMAIGGIHAGEIDGKDAGFWLLRELLEGKAAPGALSKVTLVFVPVFNVDGHERFGPNHRPNQNGPEAMGWRVTAANLNLNRDFCKADAPEMAALLKLLGRYDPILLLDLHVTDGAKFQHDVAVILEPVGVGDPKLSALGKAARDSVLAQLRAQGHLPISFYPSFRTADDPASGFNHGLSSPRLSHSYRMLKNRFGVLVETHSWRDYATRVKATRDVVLSLLTHAAADAPAWVAAAKAADEADRRRAGAEAVLSYQVSGKSQPLAFLGYAYTREPSQVSGQLWTRYDDTRPEVWNVPLFAERVPRSKAQLPAVGYLIPAAHAGWMAEKLKLHGLQFEVLKKPRHAVAVESYRATEVAFSPELSEGRTRLTTRGRWSPDTQDLAPGSLLVPSAQRWSLLLAHLLDPEGPDSFLQWGFFNASFEQKEYMEDYVAEELARKLLEEPAVKAEFEKRLADPAFAQSPAARLRFFYERHPSFDARLNLYPVYRVQN